VPYFHYDDRGERTMSQTTQNTINTQGPMTAMQHLSRLQFGTQGPHGDELCEQIDDKMGVNDTFGDEIHEQFSSLMRFIVQFKDTDTPFKLFKSEYWDINPDVIQAAEAINAHSQKHPDDNKLVTTMEASLLLCAGKEDSLLGQSISNELQGSKNQSFWKDLIEAVSEKVSLGPDAP
jgi:hypothetical protein